MNAQVVMDTLRRIHDEDGRMIVCNLHTLDTARRYCDRVIGMRDGRVVFDGYPEELTTRAARDIYGADESFSEACDIDLDRDARTGVRADPGTGIRQLIRSPPAIAWRWPSNQENYHEETARSAARVGRTDGSRPRPGQDQEFRIGILGGENAQDRLTSYECLREVHGRGDRRAGEAVHAGRL